jgi:hypothetical protein
MNWNWPVKENVVLSHPRQPTCRSGDGEKLTDGVDVRELENDGDGGADGVIDALTLEEGDDGGDALDETDLLKLALTLRLPLSEALALRLPVVDTDPVPLPERLCVPVAVRELVPADTHLAARRAENIRWAAACTRWVKRTPARKNRPPGKRRGQHGLMQAQRCTSNK